MKSFQQSQISEIIKELSKGSVVALPTETVYGLGVKYDSPGAIEKLMKIKNRAIGSGKIFTIMLADIDQIEDFAKMSELARKVAENYFPGALTLVLPKNRKFTNFYFDNFNTIGIRIPDHSFMLNLLKKTGPLVVTSANRRGEMALLDSESIVEQIPELDAVVLGKAGGQKPSTVAKIIDDEIHILRKGEISLKEKLGGSSCKRFFTIE